MEEKREIVDNFFELFIFQEVECGKKRGSVQVVDSDFGGTSLYYATSFCNMSARTNVFTICFTVKPAD